MLAFCVLVGVALIPASVSAAIFHAGDTYQLTERETITADMYLASGETVLSGTVLGDVVAAGGSVLLNGTISNDVSIAGGSIDIFSVIGDDLRAAGGKILLDGSVQGDALLAGRTVHILPNAHIDGDLRIAGATIIIEGMVEGNVKIYGDTVSLSGTLLGNSEVYAGELSVNTGATLVGDLDYTAPDEARIHPEAEIQGELFFTKRSDSVLTNPGPAIAWAFGTFFLVRLISAIIGGLVLLWLFKRFSQKVAQKILLDFGKQFLHGLGVLLIGPLVVILLLATGIGLPLGVLIGFLYSVLLIAASLYSGIVCGAAILWATKRELEVTWSWALLGIVLLGILRIIPGVGWLVWLAFMIPALGYLSECLYRGLRSE